MQKQDALDKRSTTRLAIRSAIERRSQSGESLSYTDIRKETGGSNATIQQELERVKTSNAELVIGRSASSPAERERGLLVALEAERRRVLDLSMQVEAFKQVKDDLNYLIERNSDYFTKLAVEIDNLRSAYQATNDALKKVTLAGKADMDEVMRFKNMRLSEENSKLEAENRRLTQRVRDLCLQNEAVYEGEASQAEKAKLPLTTRLDDFFDEDES